MVRKTKPFSIIFALMLGLSLTFTLMWGLSHVPIVYAANITVNTTVDELNSDGDCSLREAIRAANLDIAVDACAPGADYDVIQFSVTTPAVITLTLGQILIKNDPLTISGPGVDQLAISGNNTSRIFDISSGVAVTLTGMTLKNGRTTLDGGAVQSGGPLTVVDAVIINNTAGADGGAIDVVGNLTLNNTDILSNTASGEGGGINAFGSQTTVTNGRFANNVSGSYGGGLYANNYLVISGTQFVNNTAQVYAGAVWAWDNAIITNAHFERNAVNSISAGAVYVRYDLQLTAATFVSNTAAQNIGAVQVNRNATVTGSTFTGNVAGTGRSSALQVNGGLWITDTQFISNQAAISGGAVVHTGNNGRLVNTLFARNIGGAATFANSGTVQILHNTIVAPKAPSTPGIAVAAAGNVTIHNSIFFGYVTSIVVTSGTVSEDYNLFHDTVATAGTVSRGGHSYSGDPAFVDAANGDYHLSANSEALNTAKDAGVLTDWDGDARPGGSGFDIGYDETNHVADVSITKAAFSSPGPAQPIDHGPAASLVGPADHNQQQRPDNRCER